MINLGILLRNGDGVPQSLPEAIHLFRQAARYGEYLGSVHLGILHEEGLGLAKSDEAAIEFYRVAARHGEPAGKFRLGRMYQEGRGTLPNLETAIGLYRDAAAQGHATSRRFLEILGVPVNPAEEAQIAPNLSQGEAALRRDKDTLYIQGNVAGVETITFVLDSGASLVSIPARLIERLRREGILQEHHFRGPVQFTGWDGGPSERETFILPSLTVGDRKVENIMAVESRFRDTSLLGLSFLDQFRSWSVDNERNVLILNAR
jgi:predicted aspartyl protease